MPKTFEYRLQVRWSDSDRLGHVNNTRFVEYLQEARVHFLEECLAPSGVEPAGSTSDEQVGSRGATVVRKLTVEFLRPLFDGSGPLAIGVSISRIGTTSYAVRHVVRDADGAVCADAEAVMVMFDLTSQSSRAITDAERAAFVEYLHDVPVTGA